MKAKLHHVTLTTRLTKVIFVWRGFAGDRQAAEDAARADAEKAWRMAAAHGGVKRPSAKAIQEARASHGIVRETGEPHWNIRGLKATAKPPPQAEIDAMATALARSDEGMRRALGPGTCLVISLRDDPVDGIGGYAYVTARDDVAQYDDTHAALMLMGAWLKATGAETNGTHGDFAMLEIEHPRSATMAAALKTCWPSPDEERALRSLCAVLRTGGSDALAARLEARLEKEGGESP